MSFFYLEKLKQDIPTNKPIIKPQNAPGSFTLLKNIALIQMAQTGGALFRRKNVQPKKNIDKTIFIPKNDWTD